MNKILGRMGIGLWACFFAGCAAAAPAKAQSLNGLNSMQFVQAMGLGINLGNTLEACGDWIKGRSVNDFETAWGAPTTTREIIASYKRAGFSSLRIPVAWSNLIGADYAIHPALMSRVQWVVDAALREGLIVVLNIHWDGGWWKQFETDEKGAMQRYLRLWSQIAGHFKNYPVSLVLESLNEEACFQGIWDRHKNSGSKARAYALANRINQAFVDLLRGSGGHNGSRHLLIAGYCTDVDLTVDPLFKMPADPAGRGIVSVHYYTPFSFTHLTKDESWAKARRNWGGAADEKVLNDDLAKLQRRFLDKGVPVIIGEYGSTKDKKDPTSVRNYVLAVAERSHKMGICPMLWDIQGGLYDRKKLRFDDEKLADGFLKLGSTPRQPLAR